MFLRNTTAFDNLSIATAKISPRDFPNSFIACLLFKKNFSNSPSSLVSVPKKPLAIVTCNSVNILFKDITVPFKPF